jgi:predicted RNA binding protein YcfA (HicA-like mRNA interferase family)
MHLCGSSAGATDYTILHNSIDRASIVVYSYTYRTGRGMDYSSRAVIKKIEADGWTLVNTTGSHKQFKHSTKPGRVTVSHPYKDLPVGTLASIEKQSGVKVR